MVTARQEPRLVLVSLTCKGGHAYLNGPDMEELKFPVTQPDKAVLDCRFHILFGLTARLKKPNRNLGDNFFFVSNSLLYLIIIFIFKQLKEIPLRNCLHLS